MEKLPRAENISATTLGELGVFSATDGFAGAVGESAIAAAHTWLTPRWASSHLRRRVLGDRARLCVAMIS